MCQFLVQQPCNQVQAQAKPSSPIAIASGKDAKNLKATNHMQGLELAVLPTLDCAAFLPVARVGCVASWLAYNPLHGVWQTLDNHDQLNTIATAQTAGGYALCSLKSCVLPLSIAVQIICPVSKSTTSCTYRSYAVE